MVLLLLKNRKRTTSAWLRQYWRFPSIVRVNYIWKIWEKNPEKTSVTLYLPNIHAPTVLLRPRPMLSSLFISRRRWKCDFSRHPSRVLPKKKKPTRRLGRWGGGGVGEEIIRYDEWKTKRFRRPSRAANTARSAIIVLPCPCTGRGTRHTLIRQQIVRKQPRVSAEKRFA